MTNEENYKQYSILYVDDEEQALKYFRKALEKDFRIRTASSVDEALAIFKTDGHDIGVLITDQRMPHKEGVTLLGAVRQSHPHTVRILTTAYTDLTSAIEAVNSGAIYKYICKPWDVRDLRGALLRAMDYFMIQRERDALLREKMSVLQRIIVADRVRSLAVLATGLAHHIRNSMSALTTFLEMAPLKVRQEALGTSLKHPEFWEDLWSLAQKESQRILSMVQRVAESTIDPSYNFDQSVPLSALLANAGQGINAKVNVRIADGLNAVRVNQAMADRLFRILVQRVARLAASGSASEVLVDCSPCSDVWGTGGIQVKVVAVNASPDLKIESLFTPFAPSADDPQELGLELLSAFFIAHHHGGDISVLSDPPEGPGFLVRLPYAPEQTKRPVLQEDCIDKLFLRYDREFAAGA